MTAEEFFDTVLMKIDIPRDYPKREWECADGRYVGTWSFAVNGIGFYVINTQSIPYGVFSRIKLMLPHRVIKFILHHNIGRDQKFIGRDQKFITWVGKPPSDVELVELRLRLCL